MGETVGAISYKTDVKSRTREKVSDTKEKITGRASDIKEKVTGSVSGATERVSGSVSGATDRLPVGGGSSEGPGAVDRLKSATPDAQQVKYKARRAGRTAQENPLGLAVGSVAAGFLAGLLIPTTQVENEKLGPIADQIKDEAQSVGQEALDRGKAVAQQAQEAATTALQAGQESKDVGSTATDQVQGLKESVKESAQNVQGTAKSTTTS